MIQYIYTLGADLISQECNGKTYTYLYDGHGSVTALSDESGKITDTYSYDAFGNLLKSTGRTANNYRYCGEQFDSTTGLYYLRARYMDTSTGRFISQDSYAGSVYDPVSLHKYLYANSNPVMYTDPSGYMVDFAFAGAINAELHKSDVIQSSAALATGMKIISSLMKSLAIVNHVYEQIEYLLNSIDDVASGATNSAETNSEVRDEAVDGATDGAGSGGAAPNPDDNGNKDKKPPKDTKYRQHYKDQYPKMPDDYQVHHTLPQKYREILWKVGIFIDEIMYLTGVDPKIHTKITNEWQKWDRGLGHIPTAEEIQAFAEYIKKIFGDYFFS